MIDLYSKGAAKNFFAGGCPTTPDNQPINTYAPDRTDDLEEKSTPLQLGGHDMTGYEVSISDQKLLRNASTDIRAECTGAGKYLSMVEDNEQVQAEHAAVCKNQTSIV